MKNLTEIFIKLAVIIVQILFLSSCAMMSPGQNSNGSSPEGNYSPVGSSNKLAKNKVSAKNEVFSIHEIFNDKQEIRPVESIEHHGMLVSYGMLIIPDKRGSLIRLSLVFRNMQKRDKSIWLKVVLQDAQGHRIKHYTKTSFIKAFAHYDKSNNSPAKVNDPNGENARIEWAHTYWLKNTYKISPNGIAIGQLVYHPTRLNLPMKLTVRINKKEYYFVIRNPPSAAD